MIALILLIAMGDYINTRDIEMVLENLEKF